MTLPALSNWQQTRSGLHQAAQVIGAFRAALTAPLPNYAHLGLHVTPHGLTTGLLSTGDMSLNFGQRTIDYTGGSFPLDGHTQLSLADALGERLAQNGHSVSPKRDKIKGATPLEVDARLAADYAQALYRIFTAIARFRARLIGPMSPMIVWPHGFDLSFLWFAGAGMEESRDPHMNFGFSPGSAGLERPYVYVYAHPIPAGLTNLPLPSPARWHTQGWTGVVLDYDSFAPERDPEAVVESILHEIYTKVVRVMR